MSFRMLYDPQKGATAKINRPVRAETCEDKALKKLLVEHCGPQAVFLPGREYRNIHPALEAALIKANRAEAVKE